MNFAEIGNSLFFFHANNPRKQTKLFQSLLGETDDHYPNIRPIYVLNNTKVY